MAVSIDEFMSGVHAKILNLRDKLRAESPKRYDTTISNTQGYTGTAYVESVGTVVRFDRGITEFVYVPQAVKMRDVLLSQQVSARMRFFDSIAQQISKPARVLNVGAGGDTAPIKSLQKEGIEVIATDFAQETISFLTQRISVPAFACDLFHLDSILSESVDFIIGNSVLGYVSPTKLQKIVKNIYGAMLHGGVFSFDLTPHEYYFCMSESTDLQTSANESAANPRKLLEFMERYGVSEGISAMAYYAHRRTLAVNMAVVDLLRKLFSRLGAKCTTGLFHLPHDSGGKQVCLTLRVASQSNNKILQPSGDEIIYEDPASQLDDKKDTKSPLLQILFIDRDIGQKLAAKLGFRTDRRSSPWHVAEYVFHNQESKFSNEIRDQINNELNPQKMSERIQHFVAGATFTPPTKINYAVLVDQTLHKQVLTGELQISREEADAQIDKAYEQEHQKALHAAERAQEKREKNHKREKQKQEKRDRKKQRKK